LCTAIHSWLVVPSISEKVSELLCGFRLSQCFLSLHIIPHRLCDVDDEIKSELYRDQTICCSAPLSSSCGRRLLFMVLTGCFGSSCGPFTLLPDGTV